MAILLDATQPRTFDGGMTANQIVEGFVSLKTGGAQEIAKRLEEMARRAGKDSAALMEKAVRAASQPIIKRYRGKVRNVTGNLGKSMATKVRRYDGGVVAIVGPRVTGPVGADPEMGSGNHAWLVEFGTGARKPGTQGRRAYVNVHQQINFKMTRVGTFNNKQFERMGRGYYFLMGSKNERTRQARMGSGYPHDFGSNSPGEMHPIALKPGETLKPMPAQHAMERTISESSGEVLNTLINKMSGFLETL